MRIEKLIKKKDLKTNSKDIQKGDIFVCTLGNMDKTQFIADAIKKGCSLVITNKDIPDKVLYLKKENIDKYFKDLLDLKYHYPLYDKKLIGITGTDGKTTTATIIKDMLKGASIGTNGLEVENEKIETKNTTPSLDVLYNYFDIINKKNIQNIVMEVSSESYLTRRIPYLEFDVGIFLNISNEHLDKHKTFDNYLECKKELLKNSKIKIINRDSKYFNEITKGLDQYLTFGKGKSDLKLLKYKLSYHNTIILFKYRNKKYKVESPLLGKYNVYNLLAAILCLISLGFDILSCLDRIKLIKQVSGRMEKIKCLDKNIMIDYAHTEHATYEILRFLKKYSKKKIITVVGCAGERYVEKRHLIGKYALHYSKLVIFTSDDPRSENPKMIIQDMIGKEKRKNYFIITNREDAINTALLLAKKKDLVLILGKGRDNYMAIGNKKVYYSDIDVIENYVKKCEK